MILLFWVINFAISGLNAWACGKTWIESKHAGGVPHFLNWCAAIMSAAGFTWCYLVIIGGVGTLIPIEAEDGTTSPLLSGDAAQAFADLGYMLVVFPIIGTGLALTVHSWGVFWRRRNFANGLTAGWNTYAQVYNIVGSFEHVPRASRGIGDFFGGDSKDRAKLWVLLLVAIAAIGGCLTTRAIILSTSRGTAFNRRMRYATDV